MSKIYEIVIWTAGMKDYADWVINTIDKFKCVKYRLYREHTRPENDNFIKNLENLGRDIKKIQSNGETWKPLNIVIIIDNLEENF